jgi:hypothetical protein
MVRLKPCMAVGPPHMVCCCVKVSDRVMGPMRTHILVLCSNGLFGTSLVLPKKRTLPDVRRTLSSDRTLSGVAASRRRPGAPSRGLEGQRELEAWSWQPIGGRRRRRESLRYDATAQWGKRSRRTSWMNWRWQRPRPWLSASLVAESRAGVGAGRRARVSDGSANRAGELRS